MQSHPRRTAGSFRPGLQHTEDVPRWLPNLIVFWQCLKKPRMTTFVGTRIMQSHPRRTAGSFRPGLQHTEDVPRWLPNLIVFWQCLKDPTKAGGKMKHPSPQQK
ncbi:hypothetical protein DPEC_G00184930 [Dallia pectoralis]|uniref:Uncharacterized protein n=1 Tax=Dallia pectoralis TaxID=75939 RepID=A0ACC2GB35_DALPE|nr:hypothetical protein DPEC_G00184930 [Dallia pectoralis]